MSLPVVGYWHSYRFDPNRVGVEKEWQKHGPNRIAFVIHKTLSLLAFLNPRGGDRTQDPEIMSSQSSPENPSKSNDSENGGAESGALAPDVRALIKAWPSLPLAIKAGIMAMVNAAKGGEADGME